MVLLAAAPAEVPPLWPAAGGVNEKPADGEGREELAVFYDALGLERSLALAVRFCGSARRYGTGPLCPRRKSPIAPEGNWGYTDCLCMVEGIVQAASLALARQGSGPVRADVSPWPLNYAAGGSMRPVSFSFGRRRGQRGPGVCNCGVPGPTAGCSALTPRFPTRGSAWLLTLHHLEFDRLDTASLEQEPPSAVVAQP